MKPLLLAALLLASTAGAQVQKWEYATLTIELTDRGDSPIGNSLVNKWEEKSRKIVFENRKNSSGVYSTNISIGDFWGKVTGKNYDDSTTEWAINNYVPFLNEVGDNGWELIDIQHTNKDYGKPGSPSILDRNIYFFKRLMSK